MRTIVDDEAIGQEAELALPSDAERPVPETETRQTGVLEFF